MQSPVLQIKYDLFFSKSIFHLALVYIILTNVTPTHAQSTISQPKEIDQLIIKSKTLLQKDIDSALFYIKKAIKSSKSINNDSLLAKSHLQKSSILIFKKGFYEADSLLQYNLTKTLPKHIKGQTLHNLGTIQYYKQDFKKALNIYLKAVKTLEQTKYPQQLVNTYSNIASINATLKNFKNAQIYLERALAISNFNEITKLQVLVNLCSIYYEQKLFKKYTESIFKAEKLAKKNNALAILATIYNNLSMYYAEEGTNYNHAVAYGKKAVLLKKELKKTNTLNITYNNIGHSYLKKEEYSKAIKYLDSAAPLSHGLLKSYIYNNLKESYLGLKQYKTALHYANLKENIKDSITNTQERENVTEIIEKYESEKKQQQINILDTQNKLQALTIKQQNYVLFALFILGLLVLFLGYLGFKNYKTKQQLDRLLLQQKLKKTQLNPHFLFNALQSIQNFIYQNNKEKSSAYLASYSKLIRLVLEKSDDNFTSIEDDKMAIESYLNLQQLNHNNKFSYTVDIDDTVDEDFDMLPTLITQPFVENAILHGLKENNKGHIKVYYYKQNNVLYVSITDNGKGFKIKENDSKRLHKSMSMNIIKEQLKNLNKSSKSFNGTINVKALNEGTKVVLSFTTT